MKTTRKLLLALVLVMSILMTLAVAVIPASAEGTPSILYLKPSTNWKKDGARFAAYFFGNGETWVSMTDNDGDGVYEVKVPSGYPSVIFCRMNPSASANNWNNKWNQTADLTIPTNGNNYYDYNTSTWDKGSGTWGSHSPKLTVAGTFNSWNTTADEMTYDNGVWTKTYTGVVAGKHSFKVTNGTWGISWGGLGADGNYEINTTHAKSKVTITFDLCAGKISDVKIECDHDYKLQSDSVASTASCTANKFVYAKCACGDVSTTVKIEIADSKLGHSFTNYVSNNDATCCEDGTKTAKCDRCDATDTQVDVDSYKTVDCPEEFWGEWDVTSPATCTEVGERIKQCQVINKSTGEICGAIVAQEEIPVIPHAEYAECDHTAKDAEGNLYESVADALRNGQSVTLVKDVEIESLVINGENTVLDLGGFTLTTKAAIVFNGQIKGAGSLVVDKNAEGKSQFSVLNGATLTEVPVKLSETETTETFVFRAVEDQQRVDVGVNNEGVTTHSFVFKPSFAMKDVMTNAELFGTDGTYNNNISFGIIVSRTNANGTQNSEIIPVPDTLVYGTNKAFKMTLTGVTDDYEYSIRVVVIYDETIVVYQGEIAYLNKKETN